MNNTLETIKTINFMLTKSLIGLTDVEMAERVKKEYKSKGGDQPTWVKVYETYTNYGMSFLLPRFSSIDPFDKLDIVSDSAHAFIEAIAIGKFTPGKNGATSKTYFTRIVKNNAIDFINDKAKNLPPTEGHSKEQESSQSYLSRLIQSEENKVLLQTVDKAMHSLSVRDRAIINFYYFEGGTHSDIVLSSKFPSIKNENSAKTIKNRVMTRLKNAVSKRLLFIFLSLILILS